MVCGDRVALVPHHVDKLGNVAMEVASLRANYQCKLANLRQSLLQKAFSGELT